LLENAPGLASGGFHYTEVVIALQPPVIYIIYIIMPQIVEGEVLYAGLLTGGGESFLDGALRPPMMDRLIKKR